MDPRRIRELAHAIRSSTRPHTTGEYYAHEAACALGAAAEAVGVPHGQTAENTAHALARAFPELLHTLPGYKRMTLAQWIIRANDEWHWSREAIAAALDRFAGGERLPTDERVKQKLLETSRTLAQFRNLLDKGAYWLDTITEELADDVHDMKVELGDGS